jgi:hypothetical protein
MWVGISLGMHAFPSNTDMDNFSALVEQTGSSGVLPLLGKLFGGLFALANALRFLWFDAIYAFVVASLLPFLTVGLWGGL